MRYYRHRNLQGRQSGSTLLAIQMLFVACHSRRLQLRALTNTLLALAPRCTFRQRARRVQRFRHRL